MQTGGCELPAYDWLPASLVGTVVQADATLLSDDPHTMDTLLTQYTDASLRCPTAPGSWPALHHPGPPGEPVEATGLVGVPWLAEGVSEARPSPYGSTAPRASWCECAPSYRGGGDLLGAYLLASLGFVVVAPDYIGLDADADFEQPPPVRHAYLNLEQAAVEAWTRARRRAGPAAPRRGTGRGGLHPRRGARADPGRPAALAADRLAPTTRPSRVRATVALVPPWTWSAWPTTPSPR